LHAVCRHVRHAAGRWIDRAKFVIGRPHSG
jgi:hypothetical protein